jgi:hypothetical protein
MSEEEITMFELTELAVRVLQAIPTVTDPVLLRRMLAAIPDLP